MTAKRRYRSGLSTIEALVATALLGLIAAAISQCLVGATAARVRSARRMQATQYAISIVEQLRAGASAIAVEDADFDSEWSRTALAETPGLSRFRVTVLWHDAGGGEVQLEGLAWLDPGAT